MISTANYKALNQKAMSDKFIIVDENNEKINTMFSLKTIASVNKAIQQMFKGDCDATKYTEIKAIKLSDNSTVISIDVQKRLTQYA